MVYENLDKNIANAMVEEKNNAEKLKTNFWKGVKTEMVNAMHNGVQLPNDEAEIKILKSMLKRCKNAAQEFAKAGADNTVAMQNLKVNNFEIAELEKLLPKEPDEAEVVSITTDIIKSFVETKTKEDSNFNMKQLQRYTKDIINAVKEKFPAVNNGIVANVVKNFANN